MSKDSIVISKIRCSSSNLKKTAILNRNHIKYIATRPGVDLSPLQKKDDPGVYVKYIHYRPRSHGLFGNLPDEKIGDLDGLSKDIYQLSKTQNIYKGIVSLREADAVRLNYTSVDAWNEMLKATLPDVAQNFDIPIQNLKWVAAVHNEAGHPHVHYMLWRDDEKIYSPYIHTSVQNQCKEVFNKHILAPDREAYIHDRSIFRDSILNKEKDLMDYIPGITYRKSLGKIQYKELNSLSESLFSLLDELPSTGRLAYKFLPPDTKEKVDVIVHQILELPQFSKEYSGFQNAVNAISSTYAAGIRKKDRMHEKADNDLRTRMANILLKQAKQLLTDGVAVENTALFSAPPQKNEPLEHDSINPPIEYEPGSPLSEPAPNSYSSQRGKKGSKHANNSPYWNPTYKNAKKLMQSYKKGEDPSAILQALKAESNSGNPLATMDLGMIYQKGFFSLEIDPLAAEAYYVQGYNKMEDIYKELLRKESSDEFLKGYFSYRLGKATIHGTGTEKDLNIAKKFLRESLEINSQNAYCQYALAKIYLDEFKAQELLPEDQKSELDFTKEELVTLLTAAATGTPYAAYELACWYDNGYLVTQNIEHAHRYYEKALHGFYKIINSEPDASTLYSLYYKIGVMHEKGLGTDKNLDLAIDNYFDAAELGNIYALSKLTNIYISPDFVKDQLDISKVILHLTELINKTSIDVDTTKQANCCLGRIYAKQDSTTYNLDSAVKHFYKAIEQGNGYAAFDLTKLYMKVSTPEDIKKIDVHKLITQLYELAQAPDAPPGQQGQAYYYLGKIYSKQDSPNYDLIRSIQCFTTAAEQKNTYALYELARGYLYSSPLLLEENNYTLYNANRIINELKTYAAAEGTSQKETDTAYYYIGRIHLKQECPNYNLELALKYLLPLAEAGDVHAQTDIGNIYLWGKHGTKNVALGKEWLQKAAQQNHEPAQRQLDMYDNIIQNQIIYHSYTLCRDIFSQLVTQSKQSHAYALEHLATHSKKLQKELQRKNQVKGAAIE